MLALGAVVVGGIVAEFFREEKELVKGLFVLKRGLLYSCDFIVNYASLFYINHNESFIIFITTFI